MPRQKEALGAAVGAEGSSSAFSQVEARIIPAQILMFASCFNLAPSNFAWLSLLPISHGRK